MSTVWFTSDLHLGHRLVAEIRGFNSPDDHDTVVMSNLRTLTRPGDTVWVLGDLSPGGSAGQRAALGKLSTLTDEGRTLHLVAGNHDDAHPLHRNAIKWDAEYRRVFTSVQPFARRRIAGHNVWLSHFPWRGGGDHTDIERYDTVRLGDDGHSWIMHGHTHSTQPINRDRRQLHIGLDAWDMRPVNIDTVAHLLDPLDTLANPLPI